ncbi:hypothetical protein HPB52_024665 [Rhipicephalus sanguineus]|uniref:Tick transposon n=1 Tax=Rhipicephalus sanguineus TaxID=34632 RepID=A0A9D4TE21_RHISA|nr:hypothetical protein HPB52_024665 [Rhipicephalus sanguineus]
MSALDAVDRFVASIGLQLSPAKTEALVVHPSPIARYVVPQLSFRGTVLPWQRTVRYLGVTLDHRLSWKPAVTSQRKSARRVAHMASSLLARGNGCSPEMALRLYNAVASARILYGLALVNLKPSQWDVLDADHRGVTRRMFALPRTSPVGPTLAETHQTPISLRAKACALRHIERMHMTREGGRLACRLLSLPHSGMGRCALEYASLVSDVPDVGLVPIPPHWDSRLGICTRIPGIRAKRNTPQCALLQEASAVIEERYSDPSCVPTTLREPVSHATFVRNTPTHVWLRGTQFTVSHRRESTDEPVLSSCVCALAAAELRRCSFCRADETVAHILLQCPGYADHRRQLFAAYGRLGLPHVSQEDLLFPCAHRTTLLQACYALLDFFGDADLFTRL